MSTYVICEDCNDTIEQYLDELPDQEKYEVCDRCARERHASEYEDALDAVHDEFGGGW